MGSWNLPFEVTVLITMYAASADIRCQQRLQCVYKHFWHFVVRTLPVPSLCFSSDILASIFLPDDFVTASILVSKILSNAGTHSGLAVRLKSFLKTLNWNKSLACSS